MPMTHHDLAKRNNQSHTKPVYRNNEKQRFLIDRSERLELRLERGVGGGGVVARVTLVDRIGAKSVDFGADDERRSRVDARQPRVDVLVRVELQELAPVDVVVLVVV
jgi:hypothetical protein